MRSKIGLFCMILGAALFFCALGLFLYNEAQAVRAEQMSAEVMHELVGQISETDTEKIISVKTKAEQEVTALMEKAVADIRDKCHSDIFGLEKSLRHHCPEFAFTNMDNITDILLSAPCIIKVKCNTFSLGLESY